MAEVMPTVIQKGIHYGVQIEAAKAISKLNGTALNAAEPCMNICLLLVVMH